MKRRFLTALALTTATSLYAAAPALASGGAPARGAPIQDVIAGSLAATAATAAVVWISMAHRSGRIAWLGRLAGFSERRARIVLGSAERVLGGATGVPEEEEQGSGRRDSPARRGAPAQAGSTG